MFYNGNYKWFEYIMVNYPQCFSVESLILSGDECNVFVYCIDNIDNEVIITFCSHFSQHDLFKFFGGESDRSVLHYAVLLNNEVITTYILELGIYVVNYNSTIFNYHLKQGTTRRLNASEILVKEYGEKIKLFDDSLRCTWVKMCIIGYELYN